MLTRLTRSLRRAGILVGAGALALAAVLIPASPAQALPSGSGWSGSWNYYTSTSYQYQTTLPGVRLTGYGTDSSGTRTTLGTLEDIANDSRCARVLIYASGAGYIVDRTVCGSGTYITYSTGYFTGSLLILTYRTLPDGTADKSHYIHIPDSAPDPTLRTVNTGYRWSYYTSTSFEYTVTRPGVKLYGYGSHQAGDRRSSLNSLEKTTATAGCGSGRAWAPTGGTISGNVCGPMGSYTTFSTFAFAGWIQAEACWSRCLTAIIPEPY